MSDDPKTRWSRAGIELLIAAAVAASAIAIFNFFWTDNGIHGTAGAFLVAVSSLLMLAATSAIGFASGLGGGLRGTLLALIGLDIIGTGFAAYMLEADWLVGAMVVALIGWVLNLLFGKTPRQLSVAQRGAE